MNQKPSVGRAVHYVPQPRDYYGSNNGKGQPYSARITHVVDAERGIVNLAVDQDGEFPIAQRLPTHVPFDPATEGPQSAGTWRWPPRV